MNNKLIKKNKCEILAPAGSFESLVAAARAGADAVYLGHIKLNARKNAQNFSNEELENAAFYCKERNKKIYLTLNTLLKNTEQKDCFDILSTAAQLKIDGIITQDLSVFSMAKKYFPQLDIHGSTQMAISNSFGVNLASEMGFKRIVLPRELSFDEIKFINQNSDIELEIFVHGALCISVSGRCLLSSFIGTRSGNRGFCAGPCRMDYKINNNQYLNKNSKFEKEFPLSLKDLCLIDYLKQFNQLGISSLKIEGRMKRPEYVAASVRAYKLGLQLSSLDENDINSTENSEIKNLLNEFIQAKSDLRSVFSRSGFTQSYFINDISEKMFGVRVKEDVVETTSSLKKLANIYKNETPQIMLSGELNILNKNEISFEIKEKDIKIRVNSLLKVNNDGDYTNCNINVAQIEKQLRKTGNTPYYFGDLKITLPEEKDNIFIPLSSINEIRRKALKMLKEEKLKDLKISLSIPKIKNPFENNSKINNTNLNKKGLSFRLRFSNIKFLKKDYFEKSQYIILPLNELFDSLNLKNNKKSQRTDDNDIGFIFKDKAYSDKIIAEMPDILFSDFKIKKVINFLKSLNEIGVNKVMAKSINDIAIINSLKLTNQCDFEIFGDYSLNCINEFACDEYEKIGIKDITLSAECSQKSFSKINFKGKKGIIAYGHLPLMIMRVCPIKNQINSNNTISCERCQQSDLNSLTDKTGREMKINCDKFYLSGGKIKTGFGETNSLLNSETIFLADKISKSDDFDNLDFITCFFTFENEKECDEIISSYENALNHNFTDNKMPKTCFTRGLYYRKLI